MNSFLQHTVKDLLSRMLFCSPADHSTDPRDRSCGEQVRACSAQTTLVTAALSLPGGRFMLRQLPWHELAKCLANSLKKGGDTAMETQKTLYRYSDDAFDRRLDRMYKSLQELDLMLERQRTQRPPLETRVIYHPVFYPQAAWGTKCQPVLMFPFNVLDRAVERFVKTVVARRIGRIQRFLGLTKR